MGEPAKIYLVSDITEFDDGDPPGGVYDCPDCGGVEFNLHIGGMVTCADCGCELEGVFVEGE